MPPSEVLKIVLGGDGRFTLNEKLIGKYSLLYKYGLLEPLDEMIFYNKMDLSVYMEQFHKILEEDRTEEFFVGKSMGELDLLTGDLSELAPIIYDRVNLYLLKHKTTIEEVFKGFISNTRLYKSMYIHYFDEKEQV